MQIAFFTTFRLYRVAIWDTLSSMFRKIFKILHVEWRNSPSLPERNYENQLNIIAFREDSNYSAGHGSFSVSHIRVW